MKIVHKTVISIFYCILHQNINFLYLLNRPFALTTALIRPGKLPIEFLQNFLGYLQIRLI